MSEGDLNIPPANVTPDKAAIELRQIIRSLVKKKKGPKPHLSSPQYQAQRKTYLDKAEQEFAFGYDEYRSARKNLAQLESDLADLREIAKLRKPSLISKKVDEIRSTRLQEISKAVETSKIHGDRVRYNLQRATAYPPPPVDGEQPDEPPGGENIKRAYALVQVLPTTPAPPTDKSERAVRAIGAIVKAHFGFFEKELKDVPIGSDFPLVIIQPGPETIKEVALEKTIIVVGEELPQGPWRILRPNLDALENARIMTAGAGMPSNGDEGYIPSSEGRGTVANWNEGICSFEDAVETLRRVRYRFNASGTYVLAKGGKVYVRAAYKQPLSYTQAVTSDGLVASSSIPQSFVLNKKSPF